MLSDVKPTWVSIIVVAARSAEVILVLRTVDHLFLLKTEAQCMSLGAPCCCKCATRCRMAAIAHAQGWTIAPCPIDSPVTPFFCVIKRRLTKVVAALVTEEADVAGVSWVPTKNWMLSRLKGAETVSVPPV